MVAAFHGHVDICNKLLELSANVDTKEQLFGWTPLLAAVWNGHREVIELLIRNNSSTSAFRASWFSIAVRLNARSVSQKSRTATAGIVCFLLLNGTTQM
jgi:ankyrin repeat protein